MTKKFSKIGLLLLALGSLFLYTGKVGLEVEAQALPGYASRATLLPLLILGLIFFIIGGGLMIGSITILFKKK